MNVWLTTKQLAERFGISPRRILTIAQQRGVKGHKIGSVRVWTEEEASLLKPRVRGYQGHTRTIITKALQAQLDELKG